MSGVSFSTGLRVNFYSTPFNTTLRKTQNPQPLRSPESRHSGVFSIFLIHNYALPVLCRLPPLGPPRRLRRYTTDYLTYRPLLPLALCQQNLAHPATPHPANRPLRTNPLLYSLLTPAQKPLPCAPARLTELYLHFRRYPRTLRPGSNLRRPNRNPCRNKLDTEGSANSCRLKSARGLCGGALPGSVFT